MPFFVKDEAILGKTNKHLNCQAASFSCCVEMSFGGDKAGRKEAPAGWCLVEQLLAAPCAVHIATACGQWAESRSGNYLKSVLPTLPSCSALPEATCLIPYILFSLSESDSHSKQD